MVLLRFGDIFGSSVGVMLNRESKSEFTFKIKAYRQLLLINYLDDIV